MLISTAGVLIRTKVKSIRVMGRSTQGVTLMNLSDGEKLVGLERVAEADDEKLEGLAEVGDSADTTDTTDVPGDSAEPGDPDAPDTSSDA